MGRRLCLIFLSSCALWRTEGPEEMMQAFARGDYVASLGFLEKSKTYREERNRLLYHLERGMILFQQGQYAPSAQAFEDAKDTHRELYTVSLSKKALGLVATDRADVYDGEHFELSLMHFYQALGFMLLHGQGGRRLELNRARASVVSWHGLLEDLRRQRPPGPKDPLRDELTAKLLGAIVHEEVRTRSDGQIALQLYKDAHALMEGPYGKAPSFNTGHGDKIKGHIGRQIGRLTRALRPGDWARVRREFALGEGTSGAHRPNLSVFLEWANLPPKKAKKQHFSLGHLLHGPDRGEAQNLLAGVSFLVLTEFAASRLGLLPPPDSWNPLGTYLGYNTAATLVQGAAIEFELPVVESVPERDAPVLVLETVEGEVVDKLSFFLLSPLGDLAQHAVVSTSARRYGRVGARLALKHLSAIAASYATYTLLRGEKNDNDFLAAHGALLQYRALARGIAASERADLRHWRTLPKGLWLLDTFLPKGTYRLFLEDASGPVARRPLGEVTLGSEDTRRVLALKI